MYNLINKSMKKAKIEEIKKKLLNEKKRLEKELSSFSHRKKSLKGDKTISENSIIVADYSNNLPIEKAVEKALRDVNKALQRIEKGIYDKCKYCGGEINDKRLKARPTSSSCIACKKTLTQEL